MEDKIIKSLYISYNAITEPIVQSQVIPYLRELSKKGTKFYLLTFEKKNLTEKEKNKIQSELKKYFPEGASLEWFSRRYHKKPTVPATVFDIITGSIYCAYIVIKKKIDVIHARAIVAALIGYIPAKMLAKKFIFDTRGIDSEEYADAGSWKRGGLKHRIVSSLESVLTKSSDHVVVLTERFLRVLKEKYKNHKINFSVIPCAVDTNRFKANNNKNTLLAGRLGLRGKFVFTYLGSLGTWYMFSEMADFFKVALTNIKNAHFLVLSQVNTEYAKKVVGDKGIDKSHFTISSVEHNRVPDALFLSDVGIFFIKPVFSKLSSSPVKFGEYLASGLPVVINYGIGDTENIVRKNRVGIVIDKFSEESYRNALFELGNLIKDKGLADRCVRTAEEYVSLKSAVEKYENIYNSL